MIGPSGVNALLRSGISDGFDIAFCDIRIELQRDFAHAHYVYTYGLVKKAIADDEWREVFAYKEDEFAMEFARPGRPTTTPGPICKPL